jgi:hypothetical protein
MILRIGRARAMALLSSAIFAQSQATPSIEVATIKPNKSAGSIGNRFDPERMSWTGVKLGILIQEAYHVQSYQIWEARYGSTPTGGTLTPRRRVPPPFSRRCSFLADQFQLLFHRETREMKVYKLVVAKNGPKLHEVKEGDPVAGPAGTRIGRGLIEGRRVAISDLAGFLQSELGRPVQEATGLTGKYDFKLEWVPDESQPNSGGEAPPPNAEGATIFRAIQEQLGLKLEAGKGPVEILVIDHAEKPSAIESGPRGKSSPSQRGEQIFNGRIVAKRAAKVDIPIHIPRSEHEAAAELKRILSQLILPVTGRARTFAARFVFSPQHVQKVSATQTGNAVRLALLIDQEREPNARVLPELACVIRVAESDGR